MTTGAASAARTCSWTNSCFILICKRGQWLGQDAHTTRSPGSAPVTARPAGQVHARIDQDRVYVHALRDAGVPSDPRVGRSATFGKEWPPGMYERQLQRLAQG